MKARLLFLIVIVSLLLGCVEVQDKDAWLLDTYPAEAKVVDRWTEQVHHAFSVQVICMLRLQTPAAEVELSVTCERWNKILLNTACILDARSVTCGEEIIWR